MTMNPSTDRPLRLWPGVVLAAVAVLGYLMVVSRQFVLYGMLGGEDDAGPETKRPIG